MLALALIVFAFFASFFISVGIDNYNNSVAEKQAQLLREAGSRPAISFGIYSFWRLPAGLHLITFLIFLSLIKPNRFIAPLVLVVLYAGLLMWSLYVRPGEIYYSAGFFGNLFRRMDLWDYVGMAFILIMLMWLLSILYRIRSTTQNLYQ